MSFLFHPLLHAAHLLESELRQGLGATGLQPRQARLLVAVGEHQPISQAALATAFAVSAASMSVMVVRMERDGLLIRHGDDGGFRTAISLTDRGVAELPRIKTAWEQVDERLREAMGEENAKRLSRLALTLRSALGGSAPAEILTKVGDQG
jgi:DNA-binding MarR family transcriptional regulator